MKITDQRIAIVGLVAVGIWLYVVLPVFYLPWSAPPKPSPAETIFGIDSLGWAAIGAAGNVVYDLLTAGILWFAGTQILSARREARINRTLAVCDRYDNDPILDQISRRLSVAHDDGSLSADPSKYRIDLYSIFNYFESIAIGVRRGLYDESIVRDHLELIINAHVDDLITSGIIGRAKVPMVAGADKYFFNLSALHQKWRSSPA
jgi:hypothetical protein